ncbi:hypothetical protein ACLOJK_030527 [Asimina triloba]
MKELPQNPEKTDCGEIPAMDSASSLPSTSAAGIDSSDARPAVKTSLMGAGLENLGNTCFLNVVLQCFTHTVPVVESLRSCSHSAPCHRKIFSPFAFLGGSGSSIWVVIYRGISGGNGGFCALCALRDHVELSLSSSGGVVQPLKLVENLSSILSDSIQYLLPFKDFSRKMLMNFYSACWTALKVAIWIQRHVRSPQVPEKPTSLNAYLVVVLEASCSHCSDTFEPLIDLSLEIEKADSLYAALGSFTQVEKIEDSEMKFTCENCKKEVSVEKQLTIEQAPAVATFHLKRFQTDGQFVEKIRKPLDYPLELDLQPFLSPQNENCVMRVSEDYVLHQEAYILFYKRREVPWFSTFMEAQKICQDLNNASTSPKSVLDVSDTMPDAYSVPVADGTAAAAEVGETMDAVAFNPAEAGEAMDAAASKLAEVGEAIDAAAFNPPTPLSRPPSPKVVLEEPSSKMPSHFICFRIPTFWGVLLRVLSIIVQAISIDEILIFSSKNPLSSPSRFSDKPEVKFSIPRNHLRLEGPGDTNRPSCNILEDGREKEAVNRLLRGMPSSRSSQLRSCIATSRECLSEGSINRIKRQKVPHLNKPCSDGESSPTPSKLLHHQRLSPRSVMHGLVSADSHLVLQFESSRPSSPPIKSTGVLTMLMTGFIASMVDNSYPIIFIVGYVPSRSCPTHTKAIDRQEAEAKDVSFFPVSPAMLLREEISWDA